MHLFELALAVMLGAVLLAAFARRIGAPYPALLALGGAALAFVPGAPKISLPPELILAVFVAPVLLEAAYTSSLRDLQDNWRPVSTLVFVAVAITTAAVAWVAHTLVTNLPWPAAIALGAIVAPPDAAAATAVLRALKPPHRVMTILEGESLFNDASALLIYRFAVAAAVTGSFALERAIPSFVAVVAGSVAAGWLLARVYLRTLGRIGDVASTVVVQFIAAFGVWLLADRVGLSGVVTIVVFAITLARHNPTLLEARHRLSSASVWETAVFVLNAAAFTLIGLQIRPLLDNFTRDQRHDYLIVAAAVVGTVILVRIAWITLYNRVQAFKNRKWGMKLAREGMTPPTARTGALIAWCGMRGIVTVAAALALPGSFPKRDLIVLVAFAVALSTLIVQGLTLRPFIRWLRLPPDDMVAVELGRARAEGLKAALGTFENETSTAARLLRREYREALGLTEAADGDRPDTEVNALRRRATAASRARILELRDAREIGDDAFRRLQEEYDLIELAARDPEEELEPGQGPGGIVEADSAAAA